MINVAWKLGHFGAKPAQRIWPSPRHGLSLPLACELDEKPFKTGVNKAKQRYELLSLSKLYEGPPDLLLRVPSARFGGLPWNRWEIAVTGAHSYLENSTTCKKSMPIGIYWPAPVFRSRKNMPNSFVFPWLRRPSKGGGYWVQKQKQLVKMK